MNKKELISKVCELAGGDLSKAAVTGVIENTVDAIRSAVINGEDVTVPGLGTFKAKETAARTARNPITGATVNVPASRKVTFKPSADFKRDVKGSGQSNPA